MEEGKTLDFKAGQYIQIDVPPYRLSYKDFDVEEEYREDWDRFHLWKYTVVNDDDIFRAYSMANHPAEGNRVMLNIRIASPPRPTNLRRRRVSPPPTLLTSNRRIRSR